MNNPTDQQQKARITIALHAMHRALTWYEPRFLGDEPILQMLCYRAHFCFARSKIWYGKNRLNPTHKLSILAVRKAREFIDKRFFDINKLMPSNGEAAEEIKNDVGIHAGAFLEMATMCLRDVLLTCVDYRYRPAKWMYLCSQQILKGMYGIFGEDAIYERGCVWYLNLTDKIGR